MRRLVAVSGLVASAWVLGGCGGDDPDPPDVSTGVGARWPVRAETPAELGYSIDVVFLQLPRQRANRCPDLPDSIRLTVDGHEAPLERDPRTNCLSSRLTVGPSLLWNNDPVTVRYEDGGRLVAEAVFKNLAPGAAATLMVPADSRVRAGDEIIIVPPRDLPTSAPGFARFYPLEGSPWPPDGVYAELPVRQPDGIHAKVPRLVGRATVVLTGMPYSPRPSVSCGRFAACRAIGDNTLGPIHLTVEP